MWREGDRIGSGRRRADVPPRPVAMRRAAARIFVEGVIAIP
jgi:hypothetical protein